MTEHRQGIRRFETSFWPGLLVVTLGVLALGWHRTSADQDSTLATVVFYAVPVLLGIGVLLLLRALKLKEAALTENPKRR